MARTLITAAEAARRLGVEHRQVTRWIERGFLEDFRIEGKRSRLVDLLEVEALALERDDGQHPGQPLTKRRRGS